jgi:hypothetical protein
MTKCAVFLLPLSAKSPFLHFLVMENRVTNTMDCSSEIAFTFCLWIQLGGKESSHTAIINLNLAEHQKEVSLAVGTIFGFTRWSAGNM